MIDYVKAATKAAETLIKYNVCKTPVSPLPILQRMENVIVVSFEEIGTISGMHRSDVIEMFGKCKDAFSSIHTKNGVRVYIVAYNALLPFNMIQRALALEMGHIVLGHTERTPDNEVEAQCFARHLLCPRAMIHALQAISLRVTEDLFGNITGIHQQYFVYLRRTPGVQIPVQLNRLVRSQFMPFIMNFYEYYRDVKPQDGSALVDFGTYMDNYAE